MRLVIDTNVVFSALYDPDSSPGRILMLALEGELELFAPESVRGELERVLRAKLSYTQEEWTRTLAALPIEWVEEAVYAGEMQPATAAISDRSDAPVVALALALRCGIVSGDRDFHPLRRKVVKTWRPKDAADRPRRQATKKRRATRRKRK